MHILISTISIVLHVNEDWAWLINMNILCFRKPNFEGYKSKWPTVRNQACMHDSAYRKQVSLLCKNSTILAQSAHISFLNRTSYKWIIIVKKYYKLIVSLKIIFLWATLIFHSEYECKLTFQLNRVFRRNMIMCVSIHTAWIII